MLTRILLFCFTFFIFQNTFAQTQFVERIKGEDSVNVGASLVRQTLDSGYVVAGSSGTGHFGPYIMRLDKNGDTLWSQIITGPDGSWTSIAQTNDSGFIACGYRQASGGNFDGIVQKMNKDGSVEWINNYGSNQNDDFFSITPYFNGYIVVGATVDTTGNYVNPYVIRLNDSGTVVWSRVYVISVWDDGLSVMRTSDNNIIVGGFTAIGPGGAVTLVMKIDSSGNVLWSKGYGTNHENHFGSITELSDRSFIVVGSDGIMSTNFDLLVYKIDSAGSLIWGNNYDYTFRDFGGGGGKTSDGNFIVSGYIVYPDTQHYQMDQILLKLDTGGNVFWSKVYGDTSNQYTVSVDRTFDGGFLIGGAYQINDSGGILIMKTNEFGEVGCDGRDFSPIKTIAPLIEFNATPVRIGSGCYVHPFFYTIAHAGVVDSVCNTTSIHEIDISENKLNIFPNPATDKVTIDVGNESGDLTIFNSNGSVVLVKTLSNQSFDISGLASGFYYVRFKTLKKNYFGKLIID